MIETRAPIIATALGYLLLMVLCVLYVDVPVSVYFRTLDGTHPAIIDVFRAFTDFGKSKWYLWPSGIALLVLAVLCRMRHLTWAKRCVERCRAGTEKLLTFFLYIAVSGLVTDFFKPLIGQARPVEYVRDGIYGFHPLSFNALWNAMPSGHATTAFALVLILTSYFPRGRWVWRAAGLLLACSRVVVNAHYVSDILAASLVAGAVFTVFNHAAVRCRIKTLHDSIFPIDVKLPKL